MRCNSKLNSWKKQQKVPYDFSMGQCRVLVETMKTWSILEVVKTARVECTCKGCQTSKLAPKDNTHFQEKAVTPLLQNTIVVQNRLFQTQQTNGRNALKRHWWKPIPDNVQVNSTSLLSFGFSRHKRFCVAELHAPLDHNVKGNCTHSDWASWGRDENHHYHEHKIHSWLFPQKHRNFLSLSNFSLLHSSSNAWKLTKQQPKGRHLQLQEEPHLDSCQPNLQQPPTTLPIWEF
jgi:hypothetical protein